MSGADERRTHAAYRQVQHALMSASAVMRGAACLTQLGVAYFGLIPKRRESED
jgi:hypothetical protein